MRVARSIGSILILTLIFAAVFFFLISSCTRHNTKGSDSNSFTLPFSDSAPQLSDTFEATAVIRYKDFDATAVIHQDAQACSLSFTTPDSLKDMSVTYGDAGIDLSYKGLSFTFDPSSIPGGAVAQMMMSAIGEAIRGGVEVDLKDDAALYSGVIDAGPFTLTADKETGRLLYLSVPRAELEIEFTEFTILPG